MNHQLKHTDIETRDFISDERRFQMKKQNVGGVLVFIYFVIEYAPGMKLIPRNSLPCV